MGIDVIRTEAGDAQPSIEGIMDVSEVTAEEILDMAADSNVYFERRGARTYLVPA